MDRIVQLNVNKQSRAIDLLLQYVRVSLAAISEPSRIPDDLGWAASTDGLAAVTWRGSVRNLECALVAAGVGYCVLSWGDAFVCSTYFSPNVAVGAFAEWLNNLGVALTPLLHSPVFILGDFNARSRIWDLGHPNDKDDLLAEFMAGLGSMLLNQGWTLTTFHLRGELVVDTSWANRSACSLVIGWFVDVDAEVCSDHRLIVVSLGGSERLLRRRTVV